MPTTLDSAASAPQDRSQQHNLSLLLLWLVSAAGAAFLYAVFSDYIFEDAYITYRYARNVAQGAGYVFTEGERVFGATSPLHTFLLAGLAKLGSPIPTAANLLCAVSCAAIGVLGGCILRELRSPFAAVVFSLLIIAGAGRLYTTWGLETPILIALVLACILAVMKGRDDLAGFLCGLAFLTRYDSALLAILLFAFMALQRKRIPWRPGLIALAVVLPWLIFAQFYFGSVMPNTLGAKMGRNSILHYGKASGIAQLNGIWRPLMLKFVRPFQWEPEDTYLGPIFGVTVLLGTLRYLKRQPYVGLLFLYPMALWLGYSIIGPPAEFLWYLRPATICLLLLSVAGFSALIPESSDARKRLIATWIFSLLAFIAFPKLLGTQYGRLVNDPNYTGRVGAYEEIAEWILERDMKQEHLLCTEPGFLTFKTGNPAIDPIGLVTKSQVPKPTRGNLPTVVDWVRHYEPGIVVGSMPLRFHGYASAFFSYPHKFVQIKSAVHRKHYEDLALDFANDSRSIEAPEPVRHPFDWTFGDMTIEEWEALGGIPARKVKRGKELQMLGEHYDEPVFSLVNVRHGAESPPFLIDFDRLSFRFAGTNPQGTVAQLVINNHVVFEEGAFAVKSTNSKKLKEEGRRFGLSSWPVGHFKGRTAKLRLLHVAWKPRHWLAIDQIRSVRTEDAILLDDFEDLDGYSDFWEETLGDKPTDLTEVAKDFGVHFAYSKGAATSLGHRGEQTLLSKPFTIERNLIHMLVLDFCSANGSGVQLLIDGKVRREYLGLEYDLLRPITWQVHAFRGQTAQIRVLDRRLGAGVWLGVDDIVMSDE